MPIDLGVFAGTWLPGGPGGWAFLLFDTSDLLAQDAGVLRERPEERSPVFADYVAAGAMLKRYKDLDRPGPLLVQSNSAIIDTIDEAPKAPIAKRLRHLLRSCEFGVTWRHVGKTEVHYVHAEILCAKAMETLP